MQSKEKAGRKSVERQVKVKAGKRGEQGILLHRSLRYPSAQPDGSNTL